MENAAKLFSWLGLDGLHLLLSLLLPSKSATGSNRRGRFRWEVAGRTHRHSPGRPTGANCLPLPCMQCSRCPFTVQGVLEAAEGRG